MKVLLRRLAWILGFTLVAADAAFDSWPAWTAGIGFLLLAPPWIARHPRRAVAWALGAAGVAVGSLSGPGIVAAVAGLALLLGALGSRERPLLGLLSWALLLLACGLALLGWPSGKWILVAVPALGLLALRACWSPQAATGWQSVPLAVVLAASLGASLLYAQGEGWIDVGLASAMESLALVAAALAVGGLTCPLTAPHWLRARGAVAKLVLHGCVALALLNVGFLALSLMADWSLRAILFALLAWQGVMLGLEYRAILHAHRRLARGRESPPASKQPVTVVVPAANDAACLAESLASNLSIDHPLRFILVPALRSQDGTVRVAQECSAAHPDRVQVVLGDTGSKAGDLNKAWMSVETDVVLLLDADETIDVASLHRGLQALQDPRVGVVQGRKVSRTPEDGPLSRFISAERRYSTWLDHVLHAEQLGSGHFGGSAALVRTTVPRSIGGWTDRTLTEDIEFTLRTHLDGRWSIAYDPDMLVREADPRTVADLVRQRTRWARGWAQNADLYLADVWRSRSRLGWRRAFGLLVLLLIAVSALWTTFVPATLLMRLGGVSPLLPFALAVPLSLVLLPSRLLAYAFAALRDPVIPLKATPLRLAELAWHAYLWILVGWLVQLHALFLEFSKSAPEWHVTGKRARKKERTGALADSPILPA